MAVVECSRTLRPASRKPTSPYKVNTEAVGSSDLLRLTVLDEKSPGEIVGVFEFKGRDMVGRASIHFLAEKVGLEWKLRFIGVEPVERS